MSKASTSPRRGSSSCSKRRRWKACQSVSPGLESAPLFATRVFRSYETHKLPSGEVTLIGFASADAARQITTAPQEVTIQVQPHPEAEQNTLVEIPYSRIRTHRGYAAPNQHGFTVTVTPLLAHADA